MNTQNKIAAFVSAANPEDQARALEELMNSVTDTNATAFNESLHELREQLNGHVKYMQQAFAASAMTYQHQFGELRTLIADNDKESAKELAEIRVDYVDRMNQARELTDQRIRESEARSEARSEKLGREIDNRFAAVEKRFEALDGKFEGLDAKFDRLSDKMDRVFFRLVPVLVGLTILGPSIGAIAETLLSFLK